MLKDKVKVIDGCWIWQGGKNKDGYGAATVNGKYINAHRLSFKLNIGEIPKGMFVCHTCDTPSCINPEHLFLGTHEDNMKDMKKKGRNHQTKKTHCPQGHEYNEANTYITSDNFRQCRICARARKAAHRAS